MPLFHSAREKRLWWLALLVVGGVFAGIGLIGSGPGLLQNQEWVSTGFWLGLWMIGGTIVLYGLQWRPGGREIFVWLGIAAVYWLVLLRMSVTNAERSHLIEYSVVALCVLAALRERKKYTGYPKRTAVWAVGLTALLGLLDELLQIPLPSRHFDWFDVGFDALAAGMAVGGVTVIAWMRQQWTGEQSI